MEKFVYLPHHLMGKVFFLISFILLYSGISRNKISFVFLSSLTGLVSGLSSPYPLFNLEITLIIVIALSILFYWQNKKRLVAIITDLSVFILISSLSLVYYYFLQHSNFPWNSYLSWEKTVYVVKFSHLLLSLGPNFLFVLISLPLMLKRIRLIDIFLLSWILSPFIGILLLSRLNLLANVRYLSSSHFIPLGILAAFGISHLTGIISAVVKVKKSIILSILIIILSAIYIPDIYENLESQIRAFTPYYYNQFLSKDLMSAFDYLNLNSPVNSVVLSQGFTSNLIPAYSHNKTVTGHPNFTFEFDMKNKEIAEFYKQNDGDFSRKFLYKYNVSYVFFGPDTPPADRVFLEKLSLKKFYSNRVVTILSAK